MNETSLAADSGEQETGIQVDLDSDDPGKSVTRVRPRPAAKPAAADPYQRRMSQDVKKRLDRMQRSFSQQLADQQAEFQRQIVERDKRIEALKKGDDAPGADDTAHQAAMDALQEKLIDAQERGDSREAAKITREMSTLDAKFWAAKAAKAGVVDKTNQPGGAATGTVQQPAAAAGGARQPTKAGVAWAKANADWWNDTVDETAIDARAYATSIHQRKLRDGEDPEDPMYFEEIGDMVRRRFPELDVKAAVRRRRDGAQIDDPDDADGDDALMGGDDGQHRNPRRAAPPSLPNRGAPPRGSRNLQTLTHADIKTMREVGLNPDDNKHVVQFLRSKNEVEAES